MITIPLPAEFTPHVVRVRDLQAGGGMGSTHAEPRDVVGFAEDEQRVVKSAGGQEVISSGQVTVNFDEQIPLGSLVTVWPGMTGEREAEVIAIGRHHHPALPSYQTLTLD